MSLSRRAFQQLYARAGSGPYVPPASLVVWLMASQKTLNTTNVSALADQSGAGNNFAQAVGGNQPPWVASGINGLPSIVTTASNTFSLSPTKTASQLLNGSGAEKFAVMKVTAAVTSEQDFRWGSSGSTTFSLFGSAMFDDFGSTTRQTWTPSASITVPFVYNIISTAGQWTCNINGISQFTTGTNTFGASASAPDLLSSGGSTGFRGSWSEELIFNSVLSTSDRAATLAMLRAKYAI